MGKDLSIEDPDRVVFSTIRTANSRLWFVNTPMLHDRILAFLARYQEVYGVIIYGFIIMGNHYHLVARFPNRNKAAFFRDFNSIISRLTNSHVEHFEGGRLWARSYRAQQLGNNHDVLHWTMYAALNPIGAGLCRNLDEFTGYNSAEDAMHERSRKFKIFNREDYNNRKRYNASLKKKDCVTEHTLTYSRLPGHEKKSKAEYAAMYKEELRRRRALIIAERERDGKGFANVEALATAKPGAKPRFTKTSERHSKRPLVLTLSYELRKQMLDEIFDIVARFRDASRRFRRGELGVLFPPGTYRPYIPA